jgi:Flp pilus assembly protein TadD
MNTQIRDFKRVGFVALLFFGLACNEKENPGSSESAQTAVAKAPSKSTDAREQVDNTLEINPQTSAAAYDLCVADAKHNWKRAALYCQKAWKLEPSNPQYAYTLAFYQSQRGQQGEAIEVLEAVIKVNPANTNVYDLLAIIYQQKSQKDKAKAVYRAGSVNTNLSPAERARFAAQLK